MCNGVSHEHGLPEYLLIRSIYVCERLALIEKPLGRLYAALKRQ